MTCFTLAFGGDLSLTPLAPQSGDSVSILQQKQTIAAAPRLVDAITSSGTTSIPSAVVLDKVIVGTAGSSDSKIVITDGTLATYTVSTAAQTSLSYNVACLSGSFSVVTSGTTAPKATVTYR